MIESADEFVRLRRSTDREEYGRAARDEASIETWRDVIERYPEMREWVAHNKSVPMEILEILRHDPDEKARSVVRQKRSWARAHPDDSTRVQGLENTKSASWKRHHDGSKDA
ncbi:MAG: hypothetical protein ABIR39_04550 [Nocardioides sp.]|uniref:hypothetical protein n=1 Tax=Nocardioides sp. TaxID=35761 RepID=UPI003264F119